jgi:hypothetical protein
MTATMMEDTINSASKTKQTPSQQKPSEEDVRTTQRGEEEDDRAA